MTQENEAIADRKATTHSFNSHYNKTVKAIIKKYENYGSIININNKVDKSEYRYDIPLATAEQINKIIKKINPNKATGPDKILPKIVILSTNIIDSHLAKITNHDLDNNNFSEGAKIITVGPIYKKRVIEIKLKIIDLEVS